METIGIQKIWTFSDATACHVANNTAIRKGPGHRVNSYLELATKIAELQFMNRDHVLLFRGQSLSDPDLIAFSRRRVAACGAILLVAARPSERRLSLPTAVAQAWSPDSVMMPPTTAFRRS